MDLLTQNSEKGLGGLDRHGEERAGVLALIWQADVTDSYGELLPWRSHQLNSVVPQSCFREVKTKNHRVKKKTCWIQWWQFTVEVLLFRWPYAEGGWMHHALNYLNGCQMPQTHAVANSFKYFLYICILRWHSHSRSVRIQKELWNALKHGSRKTFDYNIYLDNHLPSKYWFTLNLSCLLWYRNLTLVLSRTT